jgi:hypothetical protein
MQQRQPRVGDIVDDYCSRERRISDHAIVAMVNDEVRLVRCTTCGAEHGYKQAKIPLTRKRKVASASAPPASLPSPAPQGEGSLVVDAGPDAPVAAALARQAIEPAEPDSAATEPASPMPEGSVHRRLIRATLPRVEGQVPTRPIPEFTMHKAGAPGKPFRGKGGRPSHGGSGGGAGLHRGAKGNAPHDRHAGSGRSQAHGDPGSFASRGPRGSHGPMGSRPPRGPHGAGGQGRPKKH